MARKLLLICVLVLGLAGVSVAPAIAGENPDGTARLNWSSNYAAAADDDLEIMPSGTVFLYVQLDNLVSIAGCEFLLLWDPPGAMFSGCYEFSVGSHPAGTGTNCAWLMRGGQVEGYNSYDENSWLIAFAGDENNTVCTAGNVARALFDFSFCFADVPGKFGLAYVKVTDQYAVKDELTITGDATILGGGSASLPPYVTSITPTLGDTDSTESVSVNGSFFQDGATSWIYHADHDTLWADTTVFSSPNNVSATFDLTDLKADGWDFGLRNPDARQSVLDGIYDIDWAYPEFAVPTVWLHKSGEDPIYGTVNTVNDTAVSCVFDLDGQTPGVWDVILQNRDGKSDTLLSAFTITSAMALAPAIDPLSESQDIAGPNPRINGPDDAYPAPSLTSINPSSGANNAEKTVSIKGQYFLSAIEPMYGMDGTFVNIYGRNFREPMRIKFGTQAAKQESTMVIVSVGNAGTATLNVSNITTGGSAWIYSVIPTSFSVDPAGNRLRTAKLDPTTDRFNSMSARMGRASTTDLVGVSCFRRRRTPPTARARASKLWK